MQYAELKFVIEIAFARNYATYKALFWQKND